MNVACFCTCIFGIDVALKNSILCLICLKHIFVKCTKFDTIYTNHKEISISTTAFGKLTKDCLVLPVLNKQRVQSKLALQWIYCFFELTALLMTLYYGTISIAASWQWVKDFWIKRDFCCKNVYKANVVLRPNNIVTLFASRNFYYLRKRQEYENWHLVASDKEKYFSHAGFITALWAQNVTEKALVVIVFP